MWKLQNKVHLHVFPDNLVFFIYCDISQGIVLLALLNS